MEKASDGRIKSYFELWNTTRLTPTSKDSSDRSLTLLGLVCCGHKVLGTCMFPVAPFLSFPSFPLLVHDKSKAHFTLNRELALLSLFISEWTKVSLAATQIRFSFRIRSGSHGVSLACRRHCMQTFANKPGKCKGSPSFHPAGALARPALFQRRFASSQPAAVPKTPRLCPS